MNWKNLAKPMFWFGVILFIEGVFIQTNWAVYGIPSVFWEGTHLHHWIAGLFFMFVGLLLAEGDIAK